MDVDPRDSVHWLCIAYIVPVVLAGLWVTFWEWIDNE